MRHVAPRFQPGRSVASKGVTTRQCFHQISKAGAAITQQHQQVEHEIRRFVQKFVVIARRGSQRYLHGLLSHLLSNSLRTRFQQSCGVTLIRAMLVPLLYDPLKLAEKSEPIGGGLI